MSRPAVATVVVVLGLFGLCAPARAQAQGQDKAAAEALFEQGHAMIEQGDFAHACPKYAESLRLDPGIGVMLHLASCWEKAGKPASAWAQYREAEQLAVRTGDTRADVARKRASALEGKLYRLTIVVATSADIDGFALARDGEPVGRAQWGSPVPINPGEHTIVAFAPGRARWEGKVVTPSEPGEATITVPALALDAGAASAPQAAPAPAEPLAPPAATSNFWNGQRIAGVAVAAAGVIAVGVGSYYGIVTKQKLDDSNSSGCQPDNHCTAAGAALRSDAQSAGKASTVAFAIGAAALAGGAVLWFTAPDPASPRVGAIVGPDGGGFVVRAAW